MPRLQDIIHKLELAGGKRHLRITLAVLAAGLLAVTWDLRGYKNMATREAMDAAQLGRNLAEGRGYTTLFLRPFSLGLLARRAPPADAAAPAAMKGLQPDIANAPAYPVVLAGLMKVLPFDYSIPVEREKQKRFWSDSGRFWRYQPDFLIAIFNQALFLAVVALAFLWARRLFDGAVAWLSAFVLLGTELLWRFSVSGLSTMFLLLIFMGLVWCLTLLEGESREPGGRAGGVALALAAGALLGLGGLTRYAFGWLIIPVLIFLALFGGPRRPVFCALTLAAFAAVMAPWIIRNYEVSGLPFGTATCAVVEGTELFPGDKLERSLDPDVRFLVEPIRAKLFANLRSIAQTGLFSLGGGWIISFFLVGLMVSFRNPAVRRMRYLVLMSLGALAVAQALGRTQQSADSPEINSENLLVLLAPLVAVYAVSLFLLLLDQVNVQTREVRYTLTTLFGALCVLPLIIALLPPRTPPVAYPPYHPQVIQQNAALLREDEWMMSDVPWAVAWYGRRPCAWLTLQARPDAKDPAARENFVSFNQRQKTISALYLTPKTLNGTFASEISADGNGWGNFIVQTLARQAPPPDFPLHELRDGYLPEQLFVADRKRW